MAFHADGSGEVGLSPRAAPRPGVGSLSGYSFAELFPDDPRSFHGELTNSPTTSPESPAEMEEETEPPKSLRQMMFRYMFRDIHGQPSPMDDPLVRRYREAQVNRALTTFARFLRREIRVMESNDSYAIAIEAVVRMRDHVEDQVEWPEFRAHALARAAADALVSETQEMEQP